MKKVFLAIALSLAIMLISSVAVFADAITNVTVPQTQVPLNGDVTITATAPTTIDQITIIVYKGASADESSIAYIDQQPNTTGTVSFTFKMRSTDQSYTAINGTYTVRVGGTSASPAPDSNLSYDGVGATPTPPPTFKITGNVTQDSTAPVVVTASAGTVTVTGNSYEVDGIAQGVTTVTLTVAVKSHITYTKDVTLPGNADVVKDVTLLSGDADGDTTVGPNDLQMIFDSWYGAAVQGVNDGADVDNDGSIGPADLQLVFNNWYKTSANYTD